MCVYVCVYREREGRGEEQREKERERSGVEGEEREISFKELIHTVVEAAMSTVCRVGWQAGDPGRSCS